MRLATRGILAALALSIVLTGCALTSSPTTRPSASLGATPSVSHVRGTPFPSLGPDIAMTPCPGIAWPPAGSDASDAITANWHHSIIPGGLWVKVTNRTSRSYFVFSGDPPSGADVADECAVHAPSGNGGRIRAGSSEELPVLPVGGLVGIYVYAEACPEGCQATALGWILLPPLPE